MAQLIINRSEYEFPDADLGERIELISSALREARDKGLYVLAIETGDRDDFSSVETTSLVFVTPATQITIVADTAVVAPFRTT